MLTWPDAARLALSIVVNVEEGAEMRVVDGDRGPEPVDELGVVVKKPIRNHMNESNYAYGIREGFPRIARLLDASGIRATFTAAAVALERAPAIAAYIRDGDHEVAAHGHRWVHQFHLDEDAERAFIRAAADSLERTTGQRPSGWLSRYLLTDRTRRLLAEEGFGYHMDDLSADAPYWDVVDGRPLVIVPYQIDTNDMKLWTAPAYTPEQWLRYATDTFDWLLREGAEGPARMMSLGLHLRVIGRPGRIWALERFLAHVAAHDGVWIATRREIAERFRACVPAPTG